MADSIPEDSPHEITVRTQARATATSRTSAPRKSPATTIPTRAQKLKAAASRRQKDSVSSTPTSRPRYTAKRKRRHSGRGSPYCINCGDSETVDDLLLECPAGDASRQAMLAVYGELGLPRATSQNLLFPACRREHIKRALSTLLDFVDGSGLRERI
ncbi:hypothetical protein MTO96_050710 [Rhipicephalus appendiculatus]